MVLMKSDGSFPLEKPGKIALYGNGARRTLKGGRGSADVNVKSYTTVEQGLSNAGFELTTQRWLDGYEQAWQGARKHWREWLKEKIAAEGMDRLMENLSIVMPEPDYDLPLDGEGEVAVYVLSRLCGEGVDRQAVPGDLLLSSTEIRDILALQKQYKKFMLVLNTGCIVDISPVAEKVENILLLSQLGSAIGDSLADVLLGKCYPSGKLAATWAAAEDYCSVGAFGDRDDTRYTEGVYVGYRYFDTVGKQPLFPFGHGLGYTTFSFACSALHAEGTKIILTVTVKNTGSRLGKEVVQLYVSIPQENLDQPAKVLAAFDKTSELQPGEEENLTLSFSMEHLASTDATNQVKLLEKGRYTLYIGNSSRNTQNAGSVYLAEDVITARICDVGGETDFVDWKPQRERAEEYKQTYDLLVSSQAFSVETPKDIPLNAEALRIAQGLSDEELVYLLTGEFEGDGSKNIIGDSAITLVGAAGETTGRFRRLGIPNLIMADGPSGIRITRQYGKDEKGTYPIESTQLNLMEIENKHELLPAPILKALATMLPAGEQTQRSGEIYEQNCTAIPIATAIAQSWSTMVAEECGHIVAEEMEHFGIHIWLAPAMNIQRHPLCGRTFEYYSEDPLISGKMAAAMTKAVQSHPGCCVTIKHFICNNQEANRFRTSSMVSQRALRDIYAKGYEIVVREAQPLAFMSSYNLLNGVHTSERYDLLEMLLRQEWGYKGMVMSDFMTGDPSASDKINKYRKFASAESIKAGNDLLMPGGKAHYENVLSALKSGYLTRAEAEKCASRNIALAWKLGGKTDV